MSSEEFEKIIKIINSLIDSDVNNSNLLKSLSKAILEGKVEISKIDLENSELDMDEIFSSKKSKSFINTKNGWKELHGAKEKISTELITENLKDFISKNKNCENLGVNIISESDVSFIENSLSEMAGIYSIFSYTFEMCIKLKLLEKNSSDIDTLYNMSLESLKACKEKRILNLKKKDIIKMMYYTNILSEEMLDKKEYWENTFSVHYRELCLNFYKKFTKYVV